MFDCLLILGFGFVVLVLFSVCLCCVEFTWLFVVLVGIAVLGGWFALMLICLLGFCRVCEFLSLWWV